jgi:hypothetical protein
MEDQDYHFLFHGTSLEVITKKQKELGGRYCRGNAGDPSRPGQNIFGEVTSTTPNFNMALYFADRTQESFDRGAKISTQVETCSPTILVVTNPQKYRKSPLFDEDEVVVYGVIESEDFTTLDDDVQFIVDNFNLFNDFKGGMAEKNARNFYERLLRINPQLKDYELVIPEDVRKVDARIAGLKRDTEYSPEAVLELQQLEARLRSDLPPIRLIPFI